ncbi:MAG: hypothetical protein VCA18_11985, partial [Opitutales bacterium]
SGTTSKASFSTPGFTIENFCPAPSKENPSCSRSSFYSRFEALVAGAFVRIALKVFFLGNGGLIG